MDFKTASGVPDAYRRPDVAYTAGEADLIITASGVPDAYRRPDVAYNSTNAYWTELLTDDASTDDEMEFLGISCDDTSQFSNLMQKAGLAGYWKLDGNAKNDNLKEGIA